MSLTCIVKLALLNLFTIEKYTEKYCLKKFVNSSHH